MMPSGFCGIYARVLKTRRSREAVQRSAILWAATPGSTGNQTKQEIKEFEEAVGVVCRMAVQQRIR